MIAYIDPGAGSFVLQAIVAAAAGAALAVKLWWRRLRAALGLRTGAEPADREDAKPGAE